MDKDKVKGKLKDVGGRIQRQAGEWTGDEKAQAEGSRKQAEGKVQNAWGKMKDTGRKVARDLRNRGDREVTIEKTTEKEVRVKAPKRAA